MPSVEPSLKPVPEQFSGWDFAMDMASGVSVPTLDCAFSMERASINGISSEVMFAIAIQNIDAIRSSFGDTAATQISRAVLQSLNGIFDDGSFDGTARERACGVYDLVITQSWLEAAKLDDAESVYGRLNRWCLAASQTLHDVDGANIVASLGVRKAQMFLSPPATKAAIAKAHEALRSDGARKPNMRATGDAFVKEMRLAAAFVVDLGSDHLDFAWVPVRQLQDGDTIAHYQGSLCSIAPNGAITDSSRAIAALRNLGMAEIIDIASMSKAVAITSQSDGPPLVVEVSASTLRTSFWRVSTLLDSMKEGASDRLQLLIIPDVENGDADLAASIAELHQRGIGLGVEICRPNGLGRDLMLSIQPHFISMAPMFMRSILGRPGNIDAVSTIHALAQLIAPMVVVQGIDTPILAEHARRAGINWGQGHHLGSPAWQCPRHSSQAKASTSW